MPSLEAALIEQIAQLQQRIASYDTIASLDDRILVQESKCHLDSDLAQHVRAYRLSGWSCELVDLNKGSWARRVNKGKKGLKFRIETFCRGFTSVLV